MLGTVPTLDRSGSNVQLTITSLSLKLSQLDTGNVSIIIAQYAFPLFAETIIAFRERCRHSNIKAGENILPFKLIIIREKFI